MKVKICGIPYQVTRETDPLKVDHEGKGGSFWGQISYSRHSIRILKSSPEQELRTLLHEIIHGIVSNGEIRELDDGSGNQLEIPISQLANGLAEVLESIGFVLPIIDEKN